MSDNATGRNRSKKVGRLKRYWYRIKQYKRNRTSQDGWAYKIYRLHLCRDTPLNKSPAYDTKQSECKAPVLELWRIGKITSLPSFPGQLLTRSEGSIYEIADWLGFLFCFSAYQPFSCHLTPN